MRWWWSEAAGVRRSTIRSISSAGSRGGRRLTWSTCGSTRGPSRLPLRTTRGTQLSFTDSRDPDAVTGLRSGATSQCRLGQVVEVPADPADVAISRPPDRTTSVAVDDVGEVAVQAVEREALQMGRDALDHRRRQGEVIGVAAHERDRRLIGVGEDG